MTTLRKDTEPIEGQTWYRIHCYCGKCGAWISTETWDEKRMFGFGTVLRNNVMPNYCPNCGERLEPWSVEE